MTSGHWLVSGQFALANCLGVFALKKLHLSAARRTAVETAASMPQGLPSEGRLKGVPKRGKALFHGRA
jgi:hypothetical protein